MSKRDEPRNISTAPSARSKPPAKDPGRAARDAALKRGQATLKARAERARAAKAAGERKRLDLYRAGELPISEWTDDELKHCRPANLDGGFAGSPVKLTAKEYNAIKRELLARGQRMLDSYYHDALKVLHEIAVDTIAPEAARVKAANLIVERTAGKVPERVEIKSSDPWQDILDEVLDDEVLKPVSAAKAAKR